jgi:Fe-S-cluster containining protein
MGLNPCTDCVGSCCKLEIDINKAEYKKLKQLGHSKALTTRSDIFIKEYPHHSDKRDFLDKMNGETFAIIKKGPDGFCQLLNAELRECSVYENRPKVCRDYEANGPRCKKIKKCIN